MISREAYLDYLIEEWWHMSPSERPLIWDYLGWTREEFNEWWAR